MANVLKVVLHVDSIPKYGELLNLETSGMPKHSQRMTLEHFVGHKSSAFILNTFGRSLNLFVAKGIGHSLTKAFLTFQ